MRWVRAHATRRSPQEQVIRARPSPQGLWRTGALAGDLRRLPRSGRSAPDSPQWRRGGPDCYVSITVGSGPVGVSINPGILRRDSGASTGDSASLPARSRLFHRGCWDPGRCGRFPFSFCLRSEPGRTTPTRNGENPVLGQFPQKGNPFMIKLSNNAKLSNCSLTSRDSAAGAVRTQAKRTLSDKSGQ